MYIEQGRKDVTSDLTKQAIVLNINLPVLLN